MIDLIAPFTVVFLALTGAAIIIWALIEFVDNRIGNKIREWRRPEKSPNHVDGVMAGLRREREPRPFVPAGRYCPLPSRSYRITRREKPTIQRTVYPLKRQGARR